MSEIDDRIDRLESLLEQQQETIEAQRERIVELEADADTSADATPPPTASRRALTAGGLLALLFGGVGTASADAQGQVGTSSDPLDALYTEEINGGVTGDTALTNLMGDGLTSSSSALTIDLGNGFSFDSGAVVPGVTGVRTDTADSFTESDVTVSTDAANVSSGEITPVFSSTATRTEDNSTLGDTSTSYGLKISPNDDLDEVTVTLSQNTSGVSTVELTDTTGNRLASDSDPGSSVTLRHQLSAGSEYYVFAEGSSYNPGYYDSAEYPYESNSIDIINGVSDAGTIVDQSNSAYAFSDVTGILTSPSTATVQWDEPSSVRRWETATYQADQNGGSVDVYVETSSDGGSTWSDWRSDPIGPGTDLSAIPADDRIRFRVEFSSSESSDDPKLTLLSRQWRP